LDTTHDSLTFRTSNLVGERTILVEKEARNINVLKVWNALCGDDLHEFACWMLYRKVLHDFPQFCSLDNANIEK
jgi:hypothetical protein|tara:strand:- start:482 stop:703 length:222 start_codon:yes stop_codon:yes gene_type:complete